MSNDDGDRDEEEYDRGHEDGEEYIEHDAMETVLGVIRGQSDWDEDGDEDYQEGHKDGREGR